MKTPQPLSNAAPLDERLTPAPAEAGNYWLAGLGARVRTAPPAGDAARPVPTSPAPIPGDRVAWLLGLALSASKAYPPDVFRWTQDALRAYAKEGRAGTLEHHLGLKVGQHKGRSAVRRRVVENRWKALGAAYSAQIDSDDFAPSRRCTTLLEDLNEFGKSLWPDWRQNGPPKNKTPSRLRQALYEIFVAYDGDPPRNANSIGRALEQAGIIVRAPVSHE